jgi:hypothetical protein
VVEAYEGEGEKSPEDKGMSEAGKWPLSYDLRLTENLGEKGPDAATERTQRVGCVLLGVEDDAEDGDEAREEEPGGEKNSYGQKACFD